MDLLIPFQTSLNHDDELRYAFRSMEANLTNLGHAWVVGDAPEWLFDTEHLTVIAANNVYRENHYRDRNICNKMLIGFADARVPDEVLVAHDDNFILAPGDAEYWPYYSKGMMWTGRGDYGVTEANTRALPGYEKAENYDLHCPHRMNKLIAGGYLRAVDWTVKHGYCIKTLYCHKVIGFQGREFYTDQKINANYTYHEVSELITSGRRFTSCGDNPWRYGVKQWMEERFPNKSKYER